VAAQSSPLAARSTRPAPISRATLLLLEVSGGVSRSASVFVLSLLVLRAHDHLTGGIVVVTGGVASFNASFIRGNTAVAGGGAHVRCAACRPACLRFACTRTCTMILMLPHVLLIRSCPATMHLLRRPRRCL
jgi:hypothetical protein